MIDKGMMTILKRVGLGFCIVIAIAVGFGLGSIGKVSKSEVKKQVEAASKEDTSQISGGLTQEYIEEFLLAYYTKEELEENRSRYKPFMTDSLYNSVVATEEEPVNQAYKGYTVDQEFQSATIYIDQENLTAIVDVDYTYTVLQEKGNYKDNVLKNQSNETKLKLSFSEVDGEYKVNSMREISIEEVNL